MSATHAADADSDALVFFGATGDLAYKQIFPALQTLVRRGQRCVCLWTRGAGQGCRSTSAPASAWR